MPPTSSADAAAARSGLIARLVAAVFFLQLLDSTIIATSLPQMAADFGVDPVALGSGFTVYMLTMAAFIPPAGWVADRFGARRTLVAAILVFIAASFACGAAETLPQFIAARAVQGAGAAMMAPVGRLLVLRNAPKSDVMRAIATITWPALFAPVLGPVIGGWITTHVGWSWNFYLNIPLGLVAVALLLALVPQQAPQPRRRFDWVGFATSAGAIVLLLAGLEIFVGRHGDSLALAAVLIGAALAIAAVRHLRAHPAPLFDLGVLVVPSFALATLAAGSFGRIAINATPFLLPLLFQVGFGLGAVETGTLMLVYFLGNLAMKSVTTPIMRRFGFRPVLIWNGLLAAASVGAFAFLPADPHRAALFALLFFAGLTRSMQFTALNTVAFADLGDAHRSAATTLSSLLQQIAMVLAVALSVAAVRLAQLLRGAGEAPEAVASDFRAAFAAMAVVGIVSALRFLALHPETGDEVAGRSLKPAVAVARP